MLIVLISLSSPSVLQSYATVSPLSLLLALYSRVLLLYWRFLPLATVLLLSPVSRLLSSSHLDSSPPGQRETQRKHHQLGALFRSPLPLSIDSYYEAPAKIIKALICFVAAVPFILLLPTLGTRLPSLLPGSPSFLRPSVSSSSIRVTLLCLHPAFLLLLFRRVLSSFPSRVSSLLWPLLSFSSPRPFGSARLLPFVSTQFS